MGAFLFHIELPVFTDELLQIIPAHRQYVNKLFSEGRVLSYSVAQSRAMIWAVINAEDEHEAMEAIAKMPLFPYFSDVICHPLLFHNTRQWHIPNVTVLQVSCVIKPLSS
jgi:muconolactone delta-isomerase